MTRTARNGRTGFTLIEISIVLVIIGLIVGGILVGQDLIKAAEIRGTLSQFDKFQASTNAFRLKYGALPGDIPFHKAARLGFFAYSHGFAGTLGYQDGDGWVWSGGILNDSMRMNYESLIYWRHLSEAAMIDGSFGAGINPAVAGGCLATAIPSGSVMNYLPPAKIGRGTYWGVEAVDLSANGFPGPLSYVNAYFLAAVDGIGNVASDCARSITRPALTPIEAMAIDSKIDDGKPMLGKVWGFRYAGGWAQPSASGNCVMDGFFWQDTRNNYNTPTGTGGNEPACNMYIIWSR